MFPGTPSRKAFTLIELLVVIAVIAILATLIFPLVRSSIQRAESAKCMANLKQIGTAIQAHVNDFGRYPNSSRGDAALSVWDRNILPYLGVEGIPKTDLAAITTPGLAQKFAVFHCPSDRAARTAVPGSYPQSYSVVGWVVGEGGWGQSGTPYYGGGKQDEGIRTIVAPSLSRAVTVTELHSAIHYVGRNNYFAIGAPWIQDPANGRWHGSGPNALFADGHVEALRVKDPATFSPTFQKTFYPRNNDVSVNNQSAPDY